MQMETGSLPPLASVSKRIVRRLLTIGENRAELLLLELHEERDRILLAILLALGIAAFGLLAGFGLTFVVALIFWEHSPVYAISVLTLLYLGGATALYRRLVRLKRDWQSLSSTLDQLQKDLACLHRTLN